jgi:hypothetical protein
MGSLSDIVSVVITTNGVGASAPGFGVPMIASYHTRWVELIRWYTSLDGMLADGFTVHDGAYRCASAMTAQSPAPSRWAVGRRSNAPGQTVEITPTVVNNRIYNVDLLGPTGIAATATFTSDGTASAAEICAGLLASINTAATGITATGGVTSVVCKASTPGLTFAVASQDLGLLSCQQNHADTGIAADLTSIKLVSSDFYGVTLDTAGKAEIVAAAAWVETNKRFGVFSSQDADCLGAAVTDVGGVIKAANEYRSWVEFGQRAGFEFGGAAMLAAGLARDPGTVTFKFLQLRSVTSDNLTDTHLTNLRAKNIGFFTSFGISGGTPIVITGDGKTAAGEWADFIRDRDWFEANMQVDVTNWLAGGKKKPYTDSGIQGVASAVRSRISLAVAAGFLASDPVPVVVVPKASSISPAVKATRVLSGISFTASVAGAIHAVALTGTVV